MTAVTGALGLTQNTGAYEDQLSGQQNMLQQRANSPGGIATEAYKGMANQGMGNVLAGISQTKGLNPSAQATMSDIAGSRIQGQTAQNVGLMGLQEQQQNQNMLGDLLMKRNVQDLNTQNEQQKRLQGTIQGVATAMA